MLNRVRALENLCFLVSANSVGFNRGIQLAGNSMMVDPWGVILTSGGDEEVILRTEIDLNVMHSARERYPALADRLDWLNRTG
jgi:predicted amidohydrolase